jgi:hypothetical protein
MRNFTDLKEEGDDMTSMCQSLRGNGDNQEGNGEGKKSQERGFLPVCLQHLEEFGMWGWATATQTRKYKIKVRVGGARCSDVPLPRKLKTNERL